VAVLLAGAAWSGGGIARAQSDAASQDPAAIAAELTRLSRALEAQEKRLADQERRLAEQAAELNRQRARLYGNSTELSDLGLVAPSLLDDMRAAGQSGAASDGVILLGQSAVAQAGDVARAGSTLPTTPVGEAPRNIEPPPIVAALPEGSGVMTPAGRWVVESAVDYTRQSSNRLVFRGVEIITGIQVGVIEANEVARDTISAAYTFRYGLNNRIELEARVPYIYRKDRITILAQRDSTITRTSELEGNNIGDIEAAVRYQINAAKPGEPVFIAGLRVKSDTGLGPFDINRDEFGVAQDLATGSGFWSVSPSISMLLPSDPVVIFAGLTYGHNIARTIDKAIGGALIGEVDPGDSIGATMGFGFALNPRFSYSIGYSHNLIMRTTTEIGETTQESSELQIGSVSLGASYRLTPEATLSTTVDIGATADAPDVRVSFRVPFAF
jgi:hypothetical protein